MARRYNPASQPRKNHHQGSAGVDAEGHVESRVLDRAARETGFTGTSMVRLQETLQMLTGSPEYNNASEGKAIALELVKNTPRGPRSTETGDVDLVGVTRPDPNRGGQQVARTVLPLRSQPVADPRGRAKSTGVDIVADMTTDGPVPRTVQEMMNLRRPGEPHPYGDPAFPRDRAHENRTRTSIRNGKTVPVPPKPKKQGG